MTGSEAENETVGGGRRRGWWRWLAGPGALVAAALLGAQLLPLLGSGNEPPSPRISEKPLARVLERIDSSVPGRARAVLVVRPVADELLPDSLPLLEVVARSAARRALRDEGLDAVEIRLVRSNGQEALRLRMSAAGDGWDGKEDWEIRLLSGEENP